MTLEYMYHHQEARWWYLSTCIGTRRHITDIQVHLLLPGGYSVALDYMYVLKKAQNSCGCWCSLTTAFTVLINGT